MRSTLFAVLLALAGCSASDARDVQTPGYKVVRTYPHDPAAFTEGLLWLDGKLYESTGLNGRSDIREVRLDDGKVLRKVTVPSTYFGEGIVDWGDEIISLTWQNQIGFRWNRADFRQTGSFRYPGEGWALTRDKNNIYMSDGTAQIRVLDPKTMAETKRIDVSDQGVPVARLNELEWVNGEILANVWMTPRIARIDPATGKVKGWIDLTDLVAATAPADPDAVLNGIAYDPAKDRLFVTGKNWPKLFEIDLVPASEKSGR
ncbi:glutaminyl-peptide cyclotransferase [Allosphingosinicella deserti]|uniref:Glutamine cyclotransferase n=1 Tax=Allosphingosinicella deserti TaxID=2116704 RepID=A0A2P7QPV5_9SPHN|nr:glutaminyl-peptide cyclotransferase [Sphingomonas deserti]PSJ39980.1 glutamine cyclotransferase [Sphingomonas deserti]